MEYFWLSPHPFSHSIPTMEFPMKLNPNSMDYSIWIPWNIPYGMVRDLIRILMNVIIYGLIPLYYIYKVKKKNCIPWELNTGPHDT
jgi:hypothetical protein